MKLYTKFYGSIEEEPINSSVSGSQEDFHIGTGPQGMKGKGHSERQDKRQKRHLFYEQSALSHSYCTEFGAKQRVIKDRAEKEEMRVRF